MEADAQHWQQQVGHIRRLQATRLRRYREDAGLSQQEVADRLGVSQKAVSNWEAQNDPGEHWPALARVLGIKESYPGAPFEPKARRAWFDVRNALVQ